MINQWFANGVEVRREEFDLVAGTVTVTENGVTDTSLIPEGRLILLRGEQAENDRRNSVEAKSRALSDLPSQATSVRALAQEVDELRVIVKYLAEKIL